ncbi:MAG TPA: hypothetical protein VED02_03950 [Methyloceanibacter sp.]|nr:hypothetical protein [Methyloceanibacter sp.]
MFRAQELEGHRLGQDETLHLWSELSSCLESQGRAIRVAQLSPEKSKVAITTSIGNVSLEFMIAIEAGTRLSD